MTDKQTEQPESELFDQTRFAEESVVFGAKQAEPPDIKAEKKTRSKLTLTLMIVFPVVMLLFVATLLLSSGGQNGMGLVSESPTPTPSPTVETELQRRFSILAREISLADPSSAQVAFPPIDFTLILEDATVLRQRRAR